MMKNKPSYKEPLSTYLRRHPEGEKKEIINTIRWVGFSALGLFLALILFDILEDDYLSALVISLGLIAIIISLTLLRKEKISTPSTILAITIIFLITWLATHNQGLYDVGVLGYPVILIVAGLILRGKVLTYLTFLVIGCLGWLASGDLYDWYSPVFITRTNTEDFFIAGIIILIAGYTIHRLTKNIYYNLSLAEQEIKTREETEKKHEEVIHQLKRKNQELDRFAVRVSHDLKTPLITLAGFLGYMEKDISEENYKQASKDFSQINEAAKTMGKFVDELLDLSRVGRITNPPTNVPFGEIVQDALKAVDGPLKAKQVQVEIDADFPTVHVDRSRIVQVLQNLIVNAIKFMGDQPNPIISIEVENVESEDIFFVKDNGIGIAAEHHKSILELFSKLDSRTEGTGIGLGLVQRIIEVHHGRIWVESELGKGATFFFALENKKQEETA
ncbi:MAG TPA: ATP-binding protein [Anaerolineales bacterium]|nr:ATP-binding protein [Anaerolineales bacterium]